MLLGRFGVGFAAKRQAQTVSLGTLFLAVQFLDLLWSAFLLLDWEEVRIVPGITARNSLDFAFYPYTHSLVAALGWSVAFGAVYWLIRRQAGSALVVGSVVFSHWVLDFVTHIPDLPLTIGGTTKVGLGLWRSLPGSLALEGLLFLAGVVIYNRTTKARDTIGRVGLWAFVAFFLINHLASINPSVPTSIEAIALGTQTVWLYILFGYGLEWHREPVDSQPKIIG